MKLLLYISTLLSRKTIAVVVLIILSINLSLCLAEEIIITRNYDVSAFQLKSTIAPDGTEFQTIDYPGISYSSSVGSPEMPVDYVTFIVPTYAKKVWAEIVSAEGSTSVPLRGRIKPVQNMANLNQNANSLFTYPNEDSYTYIPIIANVENEGFIDGVNHVVNVSIIVMDYDGQHSATAYSSITIRLVYSIGTDADLTQIHPIIPPARSRYIDLEKLVINPSDIEKFSYFHNSELKNQIAKDNYYIIVPKDLEYDVKDLAIWKRQKGYNVVIKTIESILTSPEYKVDSLTERVDEAASLRAYLQDEFRQNGAFFCFLVGNDLTSMPIRKVYWNEYKDGALKGSFVTEQRNDGTYALPTDVYFSDLTQVWNLNREFDGAVYTIPINKVFYNPDIYIGRLLCSNSLEIRNYINKLILYESNPGYGDNDYLDKICFFESQDGLLNSSKETREYLQSFLSIDLLQDAGDQTYPTGESVISHISKSGISSWHGHGTPYGVAVSNNGTTNPPRKYITSLDQIAGYGNAECDIPDWFTDESGNGIDNMSNYNKPSVVYSTSCINAPFDRLDWGNYKFNKYHNLAEEFTVGGHYGGPAFLGNSRNGYIQFSEKLELEFFQLLKSFPKISIAEEVSKFRYQSGPYPQYISATHNLIGEPEFEIWYGKPDYIDWLSMKAYSTAWFSKPEALGSIWTIWNGNDRFFSYRCQGKTPLVNSELLNKDHVVSVWKSGYLPMIHYNGINNVISNESKRLIVRSATLGYSLNGILSLNKFFVSDGGVLSIHAVDSISGSSNFEVKSGGNVNLDCDQKVELAGSTICSGGKMTVEAEKVTLGPGFKVEAGGTLTITTK